MIMCFLYFMCSFVLFTVLPFNDTLVLALEEPETIFTIQVASHRNTSAAQDEYDHIVRTLDRESLDFLRIEKIGQYYSLRLGKSKDRADMEALSKSITSQIPSHRIMDAYFIEERIIKIYQPVTAEEKPENKTRAVEKPLPEKISQEKDEAEKKVQLSKIEEPFKLKRRSRTKKAESVFEKRNGANVKVKLKAGIPGLCYDCHLELKKGERDRYVHFLFKQGKCITCHNSHVSKIKALMIDDVDSLCKGCHEDIRKLVETTTIHGALRENSCTECHFPHSGENKHLLVSEEKSLCLNCHENLNDQFAKPYICAPFREGKCSACHNSHASPVNDLLVSVPNGLCKKCHGPQCKAGTVSIATIVQGSDCTSCHSGHSSTDKGLLGPYGHKVFLEKQCEECHNPIRSRGEITTKIEGEALCFNCHKKSMSKYEYVENDIHVKDTRNTCIFCHDHHASSQKNLTKKESTLCKKCHESTERRTSAMENALKSVECEPVRDRKCFECHIPSHSSRPLNYRIDEIDLCARCHSAEHKIVHPLGDGVVDPRNGSTLTCNSCHSMHSANADYMLTHDRKRALCIQCHKM